MPKKVILDIDSVGDDILAVILGAYAEEIDLLGITVQSGACGDLQQATWVPMNLLDLMKKDIKVYPGSAEPVKKPEPINGDPVNFFEEYRWKFGDRLDNFNTREKEPKQPVEVTGAVDFIVDTVRNTNDVTIVTTGPLTNLYWALKKDPTIAHKVKEVFMLGGAFRSPGNITPVVEYNIFADPEAAHHVLNSDLKITLLPLDVCENNDFADGMMTRDHLYEIQTEMPDHPVAKYLTRKFPIYIDVWREYFQLAGFPMDDVITLALAIDETLCEYTDPVHVDVELNGDLTRGQTIAYLWNQINHFPQREKKNVRIAKSLKGKTFMNLFTKTIIDGMKRDKT